MLKNILTLLLIGMVGLCRAQTFIGSGGSTMVSNSMSVSYSIGEIAISTLSNVDKVYTQGFLQPNIGRTVAVSVTESPYTMVLFPNPVKDEINLKLPLDHFFQYHIFSNGQSIKSGVLDGKPITTSHLTPGIYFLQLTAKDAQISKTIKFVKI